MKHTLVIFSLVLLLSIGITKGQAPMISAEERAELGMTAMMAWYNQETGIWDTTGWWNSANALYAMIDYMMRTDSTIYLDQIENTYRVNENGGFLNFYFDDQGWWALAWVHAYDLTGQTKYLTMAESIFANMTTGWDQICGGGIWWTKERGYKNAIANSLFLITAAKLYNRTQEPRYLDWAQRTWTWFDQSGMINELNLVNDGLRDCQNNRDITWTYNQGVVIGGLVELYKATNDESLLDRAKLIADATIELIVEEGILREPCELSFNCGGDGPQFKGVFMRHLRALYDVTQEVRYREFLELNANSIWDVARNEENQFGLKWGTRFDRADASRQSSAMDAINGAIFDS
jgi:predicted alpha-1,6-mannanase (GH76 family)